MHMCVRPHKHFGQICSPVQGSWPALPGGTGRLPPVCRGDTSAHASLLVDACVSGMAGEATRK